MEKFNYSLQIQYDKVLPHAPSKMASCSGLVRKLATVQAGLLSALTKACAAPSNINGNWLDIAGNAR